MSNSDERLMEAVDLYLKSVEEGSPADRETLLQQYADVADELQECLGSLDFISAATCGTDLSQESSGDLGGDNSSDVEFSPSVVGDFRLLEPLGHGGMGTVVLAVQLSLNRRVALKMLPIAAGFDENRRTRFRHEAMAAAALSHEHIVPVYAVGEDSGIHYYAMQLIQGRSLGQLLRNPVTAGSETLTNSADTTPHEGVPLRQDAVTRFASFSRQDLAARFATVADALNHAHEAGIVHRDVKPSNLLLDNDGKLWLTDFGLALRTGNDALTMTGDVVGTLRFMSPEQIRGNRNTVDHRSDIYSLGLTLFEAATRQPAFSAGHRAELIRSITEDGPRSPSAADPRIPHDLETIILQSVSREPDNRYQSAADMAEDLRRFAAGRPIRARRPSVLQRIRELSRRHRNLVRTAGVLAFFAFVSLVAGNLILAREQTRTRDALSRSLLLLDASRDTIEELSSVIADYDYANEPAYAGVVHDFATASVRRLQDLRTHAPEDTALRQTLMVHCDAMTRAASASGEYELADELNARLSVLAAELADDFSRDLRKNSENADAAVSFAQCSLMSAESLRRSGGSLTQCSAQLQSAEEALQRTIRISQNSPQVFMWLAVLQAERASGFHAGLETEDRIRLSEEAVSNAEKGLASISAADSNRRQFRSRLRDIIECRCDVLEVCGQTELIEDAAAARLRISSELAADEFSQENAALLCHACNRSLHLMTRSGRWKEAAELTDRYLLTARRAFELYPTMRLRRRVVEAVHWKLHVSEVNQVTVNPEPLLREALDVCYAEGVGRPLSLLGIVAFRSAIRLARDTQVSPAERRKAIDLCLHTMQVGADAKPGPFDAASVFRQLEQLRQYPEYTETDRSAAAAP